MSILHINDFPKFDNSKVSFEIHSYNPHGNSFKSNDEIRMPINRQDIYIHFSQLHHIYIERRASVASKDDAKKVTRKSVNFTNNHISFIFQDIRYEINGVEIDRIKNASITTILKSYKSMNEAESKAAAVWGWSLNGFRDNVPTLASLYP